MQDKRLKAECARPRAAWAQGYNIEIITAVNRPTVKLLNPPASSILLGNSRGRALAYNTDTAQSPVCMNPCTLLPGDCLWWGLHSSSWHTLPHLKSTMCAAHFRLPLQQAALHLLHSGLQPQQLS